MSQQITDLIHHPYKPAQGFAAPQPGIFKASTIIFPNVAAMRSRDWRVKTAYSYGLHGTPTTFTLEARIAALEGGNDCLLAPSGLAAIALVNMALLRTGDKMLIPSNVYGPNKALAEAELARWGIECALYDPMNLADLADKLDAKVRLVWLEAPGSVTMEFPDLAGMIRLCRERGVMTALDNTWGAGLAFNAFDVAGESVDISAQALTKYPSGGGDVLMGSVVTRDHALHIRLKGTHMRMGLGVAANDCEAVLRSLPSIALRYDAHDAASRQLAQWLGQREEISAVLHPAVAGAPGHEHWKAHCPGGRAAGLFSVVFQDRFAVEQVDRFCDSLKLFKLGFSWGGPVSLVMPYDIPSMRGSQWPHRGMLVRFSIGLEAAADLQDDLSQALASLQK
ncbi:MAG: PLP-dependent transferase [Pseudomonadota bacterium]